MPTVAKKKKPQPTAFGRALKERRVGIGLTQLELAEAVGINRVQLAKLETSPDANPTIDTLKKLAAALGCTPNDLLC